MITHVEFFGGPLDGEKKAVHGDPLTLVFPIAPSPIAGYVEKPPLPMDIQYTTVVYEKTRDGRMVFQGYRK